MLWRYVKRWRHADKYPTGAKDAKTLNVISHVSNKLRQKMFHSDIFVGWILKLFMMLKTGFKYEKIRKIRIHVQILRVDSTADMPLIQS
jgi:hypothetical protein